MPTAQDEQLLTPKERAALDYIRNHPGCEVREVQRAIGSSFAVTRTKVHSLLNRGFVGRQDGLNVTAVGRFYPAKVD